MSQKPIHIWQLIQAKILFDKKKKIESKNWKWINWTNKNDNVAIMESKPLKHSQYFFLAAFFFGRFLLLCCSFFSYVFQTEPFFFRYSVCTVFNWSVFLFRYAYIVTTSRRCNLIYRNENPATQKTQNWKNKKKQNVFCSQPMSTTHIQNIEFDKLNISGIWWWGKAKG